MKIFDDNGYIFPDVQDILYELGNIGLGMTSVTLGRMIGIRMHIGVPSILPADISSMEAWGDKKERIGILTEFHKNIMGFMLFLLDKELMDSVVEKNGGHKDGSSWNQKLGELEEFGNLISASYLKAVCQYSGIRVYVKPVWVRKGPGEQLIKDAIGLLHTRYRRGIIVDTSFSVVYEDGSVLENAGRVLMIPREESVEKMIGPLLECL